jgi:predicted HicB family RNase H-like nuclease
MVPTIPHIEYKGYVGRAVYDIPAQLFRGEVTNTGATITFTGKYISDTKRAMRDAVDAYITRCRENGEQPEVPTPIGSGGRG